MVHYKLHYFDLGGRGEFIRQIFAQAGVEFEDFRIDLQKQWPEVKSNYPSGQLPVLEIDGKMLEQSYAIGRFLARKFDLAGKDDWEAAKADMYIYGIEDALMKLRPLFGAALFGKGDKDEELTKAKAEVLEPFFIKYEHCLKENGGEHFVGKNLTWADIAIADFVDRLTLIDVHILDGHSSLKDFVHRIHSLPNIKKHIETRPKMPF